MPLAPLALAALALLAAAAPAPAQTSSLAHVRRMVPFVPPTQGGASGDVDGDGDVDVLLALEAGVGLLRNRGTGIFEFEPDVASSAVGLLPVLGDVDGDGDLDLLLRIAGQCRGFLNDGAGAFTPHPAPPVPWPGWLPVLEDFDGDGDLDMFFDGLAPGTLYLNSGSGAFVEAPLPGLPTNVPQLFGVVGGDLDGDGDVDLTDVGTIYLNDGSGTFALGQYPTVSWLTRGQGLGDVDGDGDLDLVTAALDVDRVYTNDGTAVFTELPGAVPGEGSSTLLVRDLDMDGDPDVLAGYPSEHVPENHVFSNGGSGVFTELVDAAPVVYMGSGNALGHVVALDDFDGDADPDAFVFGRADLYLNDGQARFVDVTNGFAGPVPPHADVAAGDVNGDGRTDVVHANLFQVDVFVNEGTSGRVGTDGLVHVPGAIPADLAGWRVALGDLDGDGDADLALGRAATQVPLHLLDGDGSGSFTDASANLPSLPAGTTRDLELGDVDGDGDLDVFVAASVPHNLLLLNGGNGVFTNASGQVSSVTGPAFAVGLADVDGDGDLDALWARYNLQSQLSLNNGDGSFVDATAQLPIAAGDDVGLTLADFDGDSNLDVVTTTVSAPTRFALGNGAGVFTDVSATHLPAGIHVGHHAVAGDFDGDGNVDLYGSAGRLLRNTGAGTLVEAGALISDAAVTSGGVAADFDGDDDLDVFVASKAIVLANVTRHVAARDVPRVGKPLTMQVFGPPSSLYVLGVSAGNVAVPLPPYGTLGIDLASAQFVGGVTSASGADELVVPIAANPNLVDMTLYWQALVGGPRFTNVEATTFTNL